MPVCMNTIHDMAQHIPLINDKSGALNNVLFVPVHFFLNHHTIAFAGARIVVGEQQHRQPIFVVERRMA